MKAIKIPLGPPLSRFKSGEEKEPPLSFWRLFSSEYLRQTWVTSAPWFLMDVALYGVGFFTPTILAMTAYIQKEPFILRDIISTKSTLILDLFLVVGFGLSIILVEKLGRMRLQILGFFRFI